jgi:4-methyl-5(b-hydroxyethyl)-thiazole monophosphate biosynthesis
MSTPHKLLVPLAEGFEEIEAVALIDVLRRAELEVVVAALEGGSVTGSHGIALLADAVLGDLDLEEFTGVVLPGGMPGTTNLMEDPRVLGLVRRFSSEGRLVAAICAAPLVLDAAGVLAGHPFTSHPSVASRLPAEPSEERVVLSGHIATSRGPGTALEFGLALVEQLAGADVAERLATSMLIRRD